MSNLTTYGILSLQAQTYSPTFGQLAITGTSDVTPYSGCAEWHPAPEKTLPFVIGEKIVGPVYNGIGNTLSSLASYVWEDITWVASSVDSIFSRIVNLIPGANAASTDEIDLRDKISSQIQKHEKNKKHHLHTLMPKEIAFVPVHQLPTSVRGFLDLSPPEQLTFNSWKRTIEDAYQLNGFRPIDLPPFVNRKFLLTKAGPEREIFSINRLPDNSMTNFGLAFDHTVPLALWVKGHQDQLSFPYKRYDLSLSFREEPKLGIGQLHGFYQADVDIIGKNLPLISEVECVTTIADGLTRLDIPDFEVHINNIQIPKFLIQQSGFKDIVKALRIIDSYGKNTVAVIKQLLHELDPKVPLEAIQNLVSICTYRGSLKDFPIDNFGSLNPYYTQLNKTFQLIESSGFNLQQFKFSPGIVRGLDYYTGMVFETFLTEYPQYGSIASGGRYDHLIDVFSEHPSGIEGVGGAIGLSRLFQILLDLNKVEAMRQTAAKVLVVAGNDELFAKAMELASSLRRERIPTDLFTGMSLETEEEYLTYANRTGFRHTVLVEDSNRFAIYRNSYAAERAFSSRSVVRRVGLF